VLALVLVAACTSEPGPSPQQSQTTSAPNLSGSVWVADEASNSITVIDAATSEVTTTLTGLKGPHNVQTDRDGARVYATSGSDNLVIAMRASVTTGMGPHGVVIDNAGTQAWVTNTYDDTVSVVDVPTGAVVATIPASATGTQSQPPHDHGH